MRIDSHQHFWRFDPPQYDWISETLTVLRRDFLPGDLAPLLATARVDGCVAVQARQSLAETHFLLGLAKENSFVRGVVGWVPLASANIEATLHTLTADENLRGVRHVVQGESDPHFLERADFNAGLRAVTDRGLTYDLLILAQQLSAAIALVDRHPRQKFVVDHIAKPEISGAPPAAWKTNLRALSERKNVWCKFSGVVTEVRGPWTAALLRPYFDHVLNCFGCDRLMFGSDWPVCLLRSAYADWVDCVASCTNDLSRDEQEKIWGQNAVQFYGLR